MASLGMSARGNHEEQLELIADLAHQEQHLSEAMEKMPHLANDLAQELDRVRSTRQDVTRLFAGGRANPDFSCSLKHSSMAHLRGQEIMNNLARLSPEKASQMAHVLQKLGGHRKYAVDKFLSGHGGVNAGIGGCSRCRAEFDATNEEEYSAQNFTSQNSDDSLAPTFLLLALTFALLGGIIWIAQPRQY